MRLNKKIIITVFLTFCFVIGTLTETSLCFSQETKNLVKYVIGPQDVLRIFVWNHSELSITVPVRIDGMISMPLVDDIQAANKTPLELKDLIVRKLAKYIEQPTVSVIIEEINSLKIVVLGNVNTPGVFNVGSTKTLIEAISMAGGLGEWANAKKIKILRKRNQKEEIIQVNYNDILNGKHPEKNILIYPGDSIIVP